MGLFSTIGGVVDTAKEVGGFLGIGGGKKEKEAVASISEAIAETDRGSISDGNRIGPKAVEMYINGEPMTQVERYIDRQLGYSYNGPYSDSLYPWGLIHNQLRKAKSARQQANQSRQNFGDRATGGQPMAAITGSGGMGFLIPVVALAGIFYLFNQSQKR